MGRLIDLINSNAVRSIMEDVCVSDLSTGGADGEFSIRFMQEMRKSTVVRVFDANPLILQAVEDHVADLNFLEALTFYDCGKDALVFDINNSGYVLKISPARNHGFDKGYPAGMLPPFINHIVKCQPLSNYANTKNIRVTINPKLVRPEQTRAEMEHAFVIATKAMEACGFARRDPNPRNHMFIPNLANGEPMEVISHIDAWRMLEISQPNISPEKFRVMPLDKTPVAMDFGAFFEDKRNFKPYVLIEMDGQFFFYSTEMYKQRWPLYRDSLDLRIRSIQQDVGVDTNYGLIDIPKNFRGIDVIPVTPENLTLNAAAAYRR